MKGGILQTSILIILIIMASCGETTDETPMNDQPILLDSIALNIEEPSGLAYNSLNNTLFVVSDQNGSPIYEINLSGTILNEIAVNSNDFEGIVYEPNLSQLLVVEEGNSRISAFGLGGESGGSIPVDVEMGSNTGLEGITLNSQNGHFFLVHESPPFMIELDETNTEIKRTTIGFADDLSGISYDDSDNTLWLVSDESKAMYQIDLNGNLMKSFNITVTKAEGIAIHDGTAYIVSDATNQLYIYDLP